MPAGGPHVRPGRPAVPAAGRHAGPDRRGLPRGRAAPPKTPAEIVRCILDSLAATFAARIDEAQRLSGQQIEVIHIVGGGSQNTLLCQLIADACRRPVVAGPVEATALGNLLVQARTHGALAGDLPALRERIRRTATLTRYEPRGPAR